MKTIEQIAAELQGYDPQALSAERVNDFLAQLVEPVTATEQASVFEALDRVLAADVVSPISVPPHDNSAMDGFAFDSRLLQPGQALKLRVAGTAFAGKAWAGSLQADQCLKIMTGAIMPGALDTVVPLEFVKVDGDTVEIPPGVVQAGDNRRLLGEDLMAGQPALHKGQTLGPAALGLIASLGLPTVTVFRRIKVAYFSTGDEILTLGEPIREGAVFDSNRFDMGVVRDEPALLEAAFRSAAQQADAIITSGGVSMGEADHTKAMMKQLGDVAFWRIAMRPGRPMAVGRITEDGKSSVLFGLPGNPVAVMVTFLAFVRPALQRLMGGNVTEPVFLQAHSLEPLRKKPGRTEYQRGVVSKGADGSLTVRITGNQGSGVLSSMVEANGLIVLHHSQGNVAVGDCVDVMMFSGVV